MTFKNKQEEESAKAILLEGKNSKFWELIVQSLEESKAFIQAQQDGEEIQDLTAEQYKFQMENFKAKKKFLDTLIKTPDNIVSWLGQPEDTRKEFDPYSRASEL